MKLSNIEAERDLLTLIARNPEILTEDLVDLVPLDFASKENREIFMAMSDQITSEGVVDVPHIFDIVNKSSEQVITELAIREIFAAEVVTGIHMKYFKLIREMRTLRDIAAFGARVQKLVAEFDMSTTIDGVIDKVERGALKIRCDLETSEGFHDAAEVMAQEIDRISTAPMGVAATMRIATGFPEIDARGGPAGGEMVIVGARPSGGKTALMLQLIENYSHVLELAGGTAGIISLEMSKEQLIHRLGSNISGVSWTMIERGLVSPEDRRDFMKAVSRIKKGRILIDDSANLTIEQISSRIRRMYKQGARLIAIDYLQLIKVAKGPENRDEKIGDITKSLKGLFKELDIPGYVLCQLNRAIEGREGATPRMSDLRESGNIENDADGIWVITRPKGNDEPNFEVHCLKGRNTGIFKPAQLWINNDLQQIRSAEWRAES